MELSNFINGKPFPPLSRSYFDNLNPATGKVLSRVPDSGPDDVGKAVDAARSAFGEWSNMPVPERSGILARIADLIERDTERLAQMESADNGKPVHVARSVDIPRACTNFRFFAGAIQGFSSESHPMERRGFNYTLRRPVGIVGAISPWNLPLYLFTWKIAPALAAGNCVVAKPSELTPMTAHELGLLCAEAGLPAGVLNIVQGYGAKVGKAIAAHPEIPTITFTGGTRTGRDIARTAAPLFKKLSLEMGGKNPVLIFADSSPSLYEEMLETTIRSSFANQGEICLCGSRIYIEEPLYEQFREDFVSRTRELIVGDPEDATTDLGAVNSEAHLGKILSYIDLAKQEGGTLLCGGKQVSVPGRCSGGWFVEPTVIKGL
ncbi:MAG: aldehyde dehydrogenase family protein, partial [Ignavibacteria bacterium]|nr:aldehyde dehydrogenase family protein [Ignavibacteria bacterium]